MAVSFSKYKGEPMAKQKIEIEVDIPDGYEFVRYGVPTDRDYFVYPDGYVMPSGCESNGSYVIVRKAWQWPPWLKADYIAMDKAGKWFAFASRPNCECDGWFGVNHFYINKLVLDFNPPPCDDWTQSLRVRPGVEQ